MSIGTWLGAGAEWGGHRGRQVELGNKVIRGHAGTPSGTATARQDGRRCLVRFMGALLHAARGPSANPEVAGADQWWCQRFAINTCCTQEAPAAAAQIWAPCAMCTR